MWFPVEKRVVLRWGKICLKTTKEAANHKEWTITCEPQPITPICLIPFNASGSKGNKSLPPLTIYCRNTRNNKIQIQTLTRINNRKNNYLMQSNCIRYMILMHEIKPHRDRREWFSPCWTRRSRNRSLSVVSLRAQRPLELEEMNR